MADYKEFIGQGKSWKRCKAIRIENLYNNIRPNKAIFYEELVAELNGTSITQESGSILVDIDPTCDFELYDITTAEKTGKVMTHAEVYSILYSLYRHEAEKRDAQVAALEASMLVNNRA